MGIVNVTPDSFSDGGRHIRLEAAVAHAARLAREGAEILDVGGESTRPGADPVPEGEELRRVVPVVRRIREDGFTGLISVDTTKAAVATAAIDAGADLVNDVTALRGDPDMAAVVAERGVRVCLMHMLGEPRTMQHSPHYDDVVAEVREFLGARTAVAVAAGIDPGRILLDPGIGFGKTVEHNLALLRHIDRLVELGPPVLVGVSRKRFIGELTGVAEPAERVAGTVAANVLTFERGARVFRVHDVAATVAALRMAAATVPDPWQTSPTTT